jgi:hypothetical protein
MRAPSPSFQSELASYRRRLVAERADYVYLPIALEILDRWREHPDAEAIWTTLGQKLPPELMPMATQLIDLVLEKRLLMREVQLVVNQIPRRKAKTAQWSKHQLQDKNYAALVAAGSLLDEITSGAERLLGRKKGTGPRKVFITGWRDKFVEFCGQPLDDVVRVLTEIAFGGEITKDTVRATQKPTTQAKRRK